MNYTKIYTDIINNAKTLNRTRSREHYYENHHIIPRCLGGTDTDDNLVNLTAREHFICHYLLSKIHPNNNSLHYAFWMMCIFISGNQQRYKRNSYLYSVAKRKMQQIMSHKMHIKNNFNINRHPSGINNPMYGVHRFGEDNPFYGKKHSDYTKNKISKANTGKIRTDEMKNKLKEVWDKRQNSPRQCPHCDMKSSHYGNMTRYHFNNCKFLIKK